MTDEEYEVVLRAAEEGFKKAKTKDEVAAIWQKHYLVLGHRALGRLLVGKTADSLLERRYERAQ